MNNILFTLPLSLLLVPGRLHAQTADSLRMDSIVHALPEVMVRGEHPVVKVVGSALHYDMQQLTHGRQPDNAWEALKLLPGVDVKENTLLLGTLPTTVIIDGKVTTLTPEQTAALLRTMSASRLLRTEVMYTAPAKMQVRGAVINIVTRRANADSQPLTAEVSTAWKQTHDAMFGHQASMLYQHGPWSVDAMYKMEHGRMYFTTGEVTDHRLDDGITRHIETHEVMRNPGSISHDYHIGTDYTIAPDHLLSMAYTGSYEHDKNRKNITGNVTGTSQLTSHSWLHNLRLDYTTPIGLKAGMELTWYHNPEWQHTTSSLPTGAMDYEVENDQRVNRWKWYLAGEHTVAKDWTVNYGSHYTLGINHSKQDYVSVKAGTQPDDMATRQREDLLNIYLGTAKTFSERLSAEMSLAAEYYHSSTWNEWKLYPTLSLTWQPSQGHYLQFSLSRDRKYPQYWAMTNFITYTNGGYNEVTGNPTLRPSSKTELQLVYLLHNKYQLVAWWSQADDYFTQTPYLRHDRLTISYQYLNFDYQQQGGLQVAVPVKAGRWLQSRLSLLGVWQREKCSTFYDLPFDRHILWGMVNLRNTVTLSTRPDITLSADGMIRSKAIQATYDLPSSANVDLALRWTFARQRATLKLYGNDIFQTNGIDPYIDYRGQKLHMDFACYREIGLSFTYRFGAYKEKQRTEVDNSRLGR